MHKFIHNQLQLITNKGLDAEEDGNTERTNMGGLLFWKKKSLEVRFEQVQRGFLSGRKRGVTP